eukprot:s681_g21.t1
MSEDRLPAWRRTGRKASDEHFRDLGPQTIVEFPGCDNRGDQQGKVLAILANEEPIEEGRLFMGHVLAIEDGYYDYWVCQTFGEYHVDRLIPLHFCKKPAHGCQIATRYRDPIHIDVFRLVKHGQLGKLQWLPDEDRERLKSHPLVVGLGADTGGGGDPLTPVARPKAGARKGDLDEVEVGEAGIARLASALGADAPERQRKEEAASETSPSDEEKRPVKKKKDKKAKDRDRDRRKRAAAEMNADEGELREAINKRTPKEPRLSALDLSSLRKGEKKKKKRKSKGSGEDDKRSYSPSSSSSSGALFRSAALPTGLERLRRVHQRYPGKIASLSLLRMRELVLMTQGRGAADESKESPLPAVAMAYLVQVLFNKYPPGEMPMRTMRELRTVAAVIDLIVMNDPLRAVDVLIQRFKALELSHEQQSWTQASQLELILSDQSSAVFRQEVKAAQAEVKSNWAIEAGPQRSQRWRTNQPWTAPATSAGAGAKDGSPNPGDDKPPINTGQPNKGKGKGKKGKGRRRW